MKYKKRHLVHLKISNNVQTLQNNKIVNLSKSKTLVDENSKVMQKIELIFDLIKKNYDQPFPNDKF